MVVYDNFVTFIERHDASTTSERIDAIITIIRLPGIYLVCLLYRDTPKSINWWEFLLQKLYMHSVVHRIHLIIVLMCLQWEC